MTVLTQNQYETVALDFKDANNNPAKIDASTSPTIEVSNHLLEIRDVQVVEGEGGTPDSRLLFTKWPEDGGAEVTEPTQIDITITVDVDLGGDVQTLTLTSNCLLVPMDHTATAAVETSLGVQNKP